MQRTNVIPRKYISYPKESINNNSLKKYIHLIKGVILSPLYWGIAYFLPTPGLLFPQYCAQIGFHLIFKSLDFRNAFSLLFSPMDSVRYFEFDFIWRAVNKMPVHSYLDVSSPRIFPLMMIYRNKSLIVHLNNPTIHDLHVTKSLAKSIGIDDRCRFYDKLIESIQLENSSFDVITSISVIEHIPDDKKAVQVMWDLLKLGGRLIISVPCAATASEEYININEYKLFTPDEKGFVFWQRYYSEELLKQQIFCVTGEPNSYKIYGEKKADSYQNNVTRKRTDLFYPFWREPVMMGLEYTNKNSISELPGVGVVAMEFIKNNQ